MIGGLCELTGDEAERAARGPRESRYTGNTLGRYQLREILGRGAMGEVFAKSPDDRFATAGELAAALAEAAANVLPDAIVERATAIVRHAPWGSWLRSRRAQTRAATTPLSKVDPPPGGALSSGATRALTSDRWSRTART